MCFKVYIYCRGLPAPACPGSSLLARGTPSELERRIVPRCLCCSCIWACPRNPHAEGGARRVYVGLFCGHRKVFANVYIIVSVVYKCIQCFLHVGRSPIDSRGRKRQSGQRSPRRHEKPNQKLVTTLFWHRKVSDTPFFPARCVRSPQVCQQ